MRQAILREVPGKHDPIIFARRTLVLGFNFFGYFLLRHLWLLEFILDFFYKIDVEISTALDKPTMQRRWTEQLPLMLQDPFLDPYEVRRMNLEILGLPNADRLLPPNQHLQDIIERENIALVNGLQIFVSPFDQHQAHIEGHSAAIDEALQYGQSTETIEAHIAEHEQAIEQQQSGLGNTKEVGGLNNQAISNENASNTFVPGKGQRQRIG